MSEIQGAMNQKTFPSETEKEIAEVIFDDLHRFSLLGRIPFSWIRKRKRSVPSPNNGAAVFPPSKVVKSKVSRSSPAPKERPRRSGNAGTAALSHSSHPAPKKRHSRAVNVAAAAVPLPSSSPPARKKRRSRAVDVVAAAVPPPSIVKIEPPETPPLSPAKVKSSKGKHALKNRAAATVKTEVASSETQQRSKRKLSLDKKQRESALNIIQDLTNTKDSINQEIEKVKQHYERLKNFNFMLKQRKQELLSRSNGPKNKFKNPNLVIGQKVQLNQANGSINNSKTMAENSVHMKQQQYLHQQRFQNHHQNQSYWPSQMRKGKGIVHQKTSFHVGSSSFIALGRNNNNNNSPIALPDLNLPTEESINVTSYQF